MLLRLISLVPPYAAAGLPVPGAVAVSYSANHAWTPSIKFNLPGGCLPYRPATGRRLTAAWLPGGRLLLGASA